MTSPVLTINNLVVNLGRNPSLMRIIDDVSLELSERETLCLVGESGSGKSVTALTVMGLLQKNALVPSGGSIKLVGEESERWLVIDGRQSREKIKKIIWQRVSQLLPS